MTEIVISAAIAFLVTIDPVGLGPMFAGLTRTASRARKRRMAIKGTLIGAGILFFFALAGETLMGALGISFAALRIGGGILLLLLAIDMIFARPSGLRSMTEPETEEAGHKDDISVFPVAIPLIAGPGAITTAMLFMGQARGELAIQAAVLGVLALVLAATLTVLLFAVEITRVLGITGINVLNRLLGILLTALACQFVLDGLAASGLMGTATPG